MQELRLQLAQARANLRSAKDEFDIVVALSEQRAIEAAGGSIGRNEEERKRNLRIALANDGSYGNALMELREAEAEVDRQEALLEGARDARRYDEWTIRARLIDALVGTDIPSDSSDPAGDAAFDDAMLWRIDDGMSHGNLNSTHYAGKRRPQPTYSMLRDEELPF